MSRPWIIPGCLLVVTLFAVQVAGQCGQFDFQCVGSGACIPRSWQCDGEPDCHDGSDEGGSCSTPTCAPNQFTCNGGVCIPEAWQCDGDIDCPNGKDEDSSCPSPTCAPTYQFTCADGSCIHSSWRCDGDLDCLGGEDENCHANISCNSGEWRCADGRECINQHWQCDDEEDCRDGSDELGCPTGVCQSYQFTCDNAKCIPQTYVCDGDNDCGDGSDETCASPQTGNCRPTEIQCSNGGCIRASWRCDGDNDCGDNSDERNCPNVTCAAGEFKCTTENRCITILSMCNDVNDCFDGSDELDCPSPQPPNVCGQHYTCDDAKCINQTQLCDGRSDCGDGKDEKDCGSVPVNECGTRTHGCSHHCVDTLGSYYCACAQGYTLTQDHRLCVDINECASLGSCSQMCTNTIGSFQCRCENGYLQWGQGRCRATGPPPSLIFSNREDIRQLNLDNTQYTTIIPSQRNAIAVDYHYTRKLLFWTDITLDVIRSSFLNGSNIRTIVDLGLASPGGLSVDWMDDLLYWTDSGSGRIEVGSLDGTRRRVLLNVDVDKPRAIVVDPCRGRMYWTDWGATPKIERASLDGTQREVLVDTGLTWPNGLTLDFEAQRLYWVDGKLRTLETVNSDGSGRQLMLQAVAGLLHPFAITQFQDHLFWTDWYTKSIYSASKFDGSNKRVVQANLVFPMDLQIYQPLRQPQCTAKRCPTNHGCEYLCIPRLAPSSGLPYRCACATGFKLNNDERTCDTTPKEFLLFSRQRDIRRGSLNPSDFVDVVIPYHSVQSIVALDYHYASRKVYWSDVVADTISVGSEHGDQQEVIVGSALGSPAGIAVDWATNKIYWTDAGNDFIEVANLDGTFRSVVISEGLDRPRDIIVDPHDRKMYWTDWGDRPAIEVAYMDGSGRRQLVTRNVTWPNGLTINFDGTNSETRRLYWADAGFKAIESIRLDGSGRQRVLQSDSILPHPFGITVHSGFLYWTDWQTESLMRSDLSGHNLITLVGNLQSLMDVKVFHEPTPLAAPTPCDVGNGGCSDLCLLSPDAQRPTCHCRTGIKLRSNGRTCETDMQNYLVVARRTSISRISIDVPYRKEDPLPLSNVENAIAVDVDYAEGLLFWTDGHAGKIMRSSVTGQNMAVVQEIAIEVPDGIALDPASKLVYWTDTQTDRIEVCTYTGQHRRVLIWENLLSPRAIALDVTGGYMYWTDWGKNARIERAWSDGTNRETLISTNIEWPNGLTLDLANRYMYWVDAKHQNLQRSRLDGTQRVELTAGLPHPYGLTILNNVLYWTDWRERAILQYDIPSGNVSTVIPHLATQMDIHGVSSLYRTPVTACSNNNGGCDHMCLNTPAGAQCACSTGLVAVNGACPPVPGEFLLFSTRTEIRRISLDTNDRTNIIVVPSQKNAIAVDFHAAQRYLFWSDVSIDQVVRSDYDGGNQVTVLTNVTTPDGIAVDWISNHIYWTDTGTDRIEVARLDGTGRKVLVTTGHDEPRDITLYPSKGLMFWSDWGSEPKIERSDMAGKNRMVLVRDSEIVRLGWPNGLTIDYSTDRLYWADAREDVIERINLDGTNRVAVFAMLQHPFGLALYKSRLYWTDWQQHAVISGGTDGSAHSPVDSNLKGLMDIQVVSANRQQGTNACSRGTVCSPQQLCLPVSKTAYMCACPEGSIFCRDTLISPTGDPSPDPPSTTPGSPPSTTPGSPPSSTSQTGSVTIINSPSDVPDSSTAGPSVGGTPAPQPNSADSQHLGLFIGVPVGGIILVIVVCLAALATYNRCHRAQNQALASALTAETGYSNPAFGSNPSVAKSPTSPTSTTGLTLHIERFPEHMAGIETNV